jgi:CubicO group peptidase (beta-lactamase class C family)
MPSASLPCSPLLRPASWLLPLAGFALLGPFARAQRTEPAAAPPAAAPPAAAHPAATAPAPREALADLAELLAPIRAKHGVPALGAAVLVDGDLAALGATGIRRHGHDAPVTPDDLWHLGSCTKAMTATLLARYVERGAIQWETSVAQALPDLADGMHADAKAITVAQLLAHRAGLPSGPPRMLWLRLWQWSDPLPAARTEVAATLLRAQPATAPGATFLYSNASYMIAGAIAERLGEAPWEDLMQRELFAPLGITTGGFGPPGVDGETQQPWGHRPGKDGPSPQFGDNPPALGPAGTAHMTLRDWAKFAALHLGLPAADGKPLLRPETLAALHTPSLGGDYALGWGTGERPWAPGRILTHNGSNTMWFCVAWLAPEARFAVLVTCNQGDASKACDDVAAACIRRFRPAAK